MDEIKLWAGSSSFLRIVGGKRVARPELYRKLGPRQRKIEWLSVALGGLSILKGSL